LTPSRNLVQNKQSSPDATNETINTSELPLEVTSARLEPEARPKATAAPAISRPQKLKAISKADTDKNYMTTNGGPAKIENIPRVTKAAGIIEGEQDSQPVKPASGEAKLSNTERPSSITAEIP